MKKLWALDIPGLPLRAFQPRLGGMCLYGGESGGSGDGPGGTDTRDEGLSYSDMYGGTSGGGGEGGDPVKAALYGDVGYGQGLTGAQTKAFDDTLAATEDIGQALDAMQAVKAQEDAALAEIAYQEQIALDLAAAQAAEASRSLTQAEYDEAYGNAFVAAVNRGQSFEAAAAYAARTVGPAPAVTPTEVAALPEDVEAKSNLDRLEEELQDAMAAARLQTYYQTLDRGGSRQEADAAADKAANDIYFASRGLGSDSSGLREESDPGYIGGPDLQGAGSGLSSADRGALYGDTGYGTGFESSDARERAELSNEIDQIVATDVSRPGGVVSVDVAQEEALGPPPEGFTGPVFEGQLGLSRDDIAYKNLGDLADTSALEPSGWTPDTMPREGDPGFMGSAQTSGGALPSSAAGTASGALPGALPGASMSPDLESRVVDILDKVRDTYAYRDGPRSTTGLSRSDLQALVDAGLGKYDLSESQTIDQALASLKTGEFLEQNMPSIIGMLAGPVPQVMVESIFAMKEGYKPSSIVGTIVSSIIGSAIQMATGVRVPGQAVQDLAQGNVGKAAFGVGVVNVAARLGLPVGTVNAALNGNLGAAAANQMLSEVVMESAKQMGADPGLVATVAVRSGLGQSAFEKIAGAINDNSIVRGINDFLGEISSGIKGFGIDTGLGEAVTSREGALAAGNMPAGFVGSDSGSGYESEQAGLIADAIQAGQPKKKIPRWSDLFFSNLARDMGVSFAGPPPVDRGELDDLEESLNIAGAYNDPSRRQDVLDPLGNLEAGGDRLSVDLGGGDVGTIGGAQDKTDLANIIREYAQLNDPSFVIYDDGTLGIRDYDLNVIHRFDSAGNVLGTYPAAQTGSEPTSDVAKELLNTSYVSSLFGDRNEQITRRLAGTEEQDRMTEDEYRALFGSGESANPPTTGTGQTVFGDVSGTFGSRADALAAFPGLSLVSKDTGTGDETYENQGFTIIAKADGSVTATPKDQPTVTVDLVAPTTVAPPPPAPSTAPPPPVVTPEDLVVPPPAPLPPAPPPPAPLPPPPPPPPAPAPPAPEPADALAPPSQQDPTAPGQVTDQTQQQPTSQQPPVTQEPSTQPTTSLTTQDVQKIVQDAMAANPSLTEQQVQQIVSQALQGLPAGLTSADVSAAISGAIAGLPQAPTAQDIDAAVSRAMTNVATQEDVRSAIAGIQFPAGITTQDVTKVISDYMQANPGLSATDVATQVSEQLAKLPQFATPADVQAAISGALTNVATKTDVADAIAGIQFPAGITPQDVTDAITQYMQQNPGLSLQDVAQQVGEQLRQLPAYATPADVQSAIQGAMTNVATRSDVERAIQGIQFPAGISRADVTDVITDYMRQNPGLSAAEVTSLVGEQLNRLPAFATPQDVESTVRGALAGYATSEDVSGLSRGLESVRADLTQLIADAQASGLKGDAALNASLEALAGELGTTRQGLIDSLGVTESGLRSEFASQIGGVQTQMTELGQSLQSAIADARAAGLQGDAALQVGLDSLANTLGTTKQDLLNTLGTTEQALRTQFETALGGVQSALSEQLGGLRQETQGQYEALTAAQKAEVASRVQQGQDLANAIAEVQSGLSQQLGGLQQQVQAQYASLTAAQQAEVQNRISQGQDLSRAIADVQSGLAGQIGGLQQGMQAQYEALTAAQQAEVQNRISQGQSLEAAINSVAAGVEQRLTDVQSGLTQQIGGVEERLGARVDELMEQGFDYQTATNQALKEVTGSIEALSGQQTALGEQTQQALSGVEGRLNDRVNELMQQGAGYQEATDQALRELTGTIGDVRSEISSGLSGVRGDLSQQYDALTASQKAEVDARIKQGEDLSKAIGDVRSGLTEQIAGVQQGVTTQVGDLDTRLNTRIDELVTQGSTFQDATTQALGELRGGLTGLSEAQQAAEEAEKERVRLQLQQQAQGQMLSTASGFQSRPSGVVEQYKASFLDPFIVGGEAPEFKSPLAGFTQSAITGGFLPSTPSQKRVDATSGDPEYFRAAEIAGIAPPLQIYDPTQEFKGLFGFRQGGLVPAFAQGGTRHGNNAHGALRVLEHSGKHRVDYRQGDAVTGIGDGQSDDIPAMLADGEFVIPADVVAALGNGSTKAGSDKLYDMMHGIRRHHRSAGPKDLPPPAKSPLEYIKPRRRAK
jgi:hypothetical protein